MNSCLFNVRKKGRGKEQERKNEGIFVKCHPVETALRLRLGHSVLSACLDHLFVDALNTVLPDRTLLMSTAGNQTDRVFKSWFRYFLIVGYRSSYFISKNLRFPMLK